MNTDALPGPVPGDKKWYYIKLSNIILWILEQMTYTINFSIFLKIF